MADFDIEEVKIRNLREEDIGAIIELDSRITGRERTPAWPQRASSHLRVHYPPLCFVAEHGGRVVGFILGDIRGAEYALPLSGWIDIMGVDPEYRGKGLGRRLLQSFVEACHRRGIKARALISGNDTRLRQFLTSLGFKQGELVEFVKGFD